MAESTLRHVDDSGILSIFVADDKIVFICEHGHYWTLDGGAMSQIATPSRHDIIAAVNPPEIERILGAFGDKVL